MSEGCNHDCGSCSAGCDKKEFMEPQNKYSNIKEVIAVISGKGGVGKSLTTGLLAECAKKAGKKVAVIDADITGPSMPKIFGVKEKATGDETGLNPVITKDGIEMMSINLLLENEGEPVIWRGPVVSGVVKQFWTDVKWGEIDQMFVDCPPGTGDVPLTIFQSLPIKGIIVVTSPQDLVSLIVAKAVSMAKMMDIPILGIVQNMSYFVCDNCDKKHYIFGKTNIEETALLHGVKNVCEMPILSDVAAKCDIGNIKDVVIPEIEEFYNKALK